MGLRQRLGLTKLALWVRPDQVDRELLRPALGAGVDLLVLGSCGDDQRDAELLADFREEYARLPLLLATDNGGAAAEAKADVVHLERPGWRLWWGYPKGHDWSLLGRNARDARTIRSAAKDFDYLFLGPLPESMQDSTALQAAIVEQPVFAEAALPWFALVEAAQAAEAIQAGAYRIALSGQVLDEADPVSTLEAISASLREAWQSADAARQYQAGLLKV